MDEGPSVYIIDDDEPVRDSLVALFDAEGLDASAFASSEQFLSHFHPGGNACLVLDLDLPGKNGLALMRILGSRPHHLPIIVITGNADGRIHGQAHALGASAVFVKPADPDLLVASVRRLLQ